MNEEQRRALFALREALRLCEEAAIEVYHGVVTFRDADGEFVWQGHAEVDGLLAEYPEGA